MIDLHVHSSQSDGTDTPEELIALANKVGCHTLALTDHDTVSGIARAQRAGKDLGVAVIPGVELSCHVGDYSIHLLGHFVDPDHPVLQEFLRQQQLLRTTRNQALMLRLEELGMGQPAYEAALDYAGASLGRPHFAAALVRHGHAESVTDAFSRFLGPGTPTHVKRRDLSAGIAIEVLHEIGATATWAHPFTSDSSRFQDSLAALKAMGLDGLEAWYGAYPPELRQQLADVAKDNALVATGGSDFHGLHKPHLAIGIGRGDLEVPAAALDELQELVA